jgi:hypothetical protein
MNPLVNKLYSQRGAIAPVVSWSTEYLYLPEWQVSAGQMGLDGLKTSFRRRLHQRKGRDLIIACREAIDLAHLLG